MIMCIRSSAFTLSLAVISLSASSIAYAQSSLGPPPVRPIIDQNDIDLSSMETGFSVDELGIGQSGDPDKPGLAMQVARQVVEGGFRNNNIVSIMAPDGNYHLYLGTRSTLFLYNGSNFTSAMGDGETLVLAGSEYTYTGKDGTVVKFNKQPPWTYYGDDTTGTEAVGTSITKPSGEKLTFHYRYAPVKGPVVSGAQRIRLQSVTSSLGYQAKYEYSNDLSTIPLSSVFAWAGIIKVELINNAIDYCDPTADNRYNLSHSWPYMNYSSNFSSNNLQAIVTDSLGGIAKYTLGDPWTGSQKPSKIQFVDDAYDTWVKTFVQDVYNPIVFNLLNKGISYDYAIYINNPAACGGTPYCQKVTGPSGFSRTMLFSGVRYYGTPDNLLSDKDSLWNTTTYQYDGFDRQTKIIFPEGNEARYLYDSRGNEIEQRIKAKPSLVVSDIVSTANYPMTCLNTFTCSKPISVTDPNGGVTYYNYDSLHGGLVSEIGPLSGGIQPVTRYIYTQRYAWVSNGSGYMRAATPVWLLAEKRTCRTSATINNSCFAGATDEIVIAYDYGPDSGPNNLMLRGKTISSLGTVLRTCFKYDEVGNGISQTSPRSALTACP